MTRRRLAAAVLLVPFVTAADPGLGYTPPTPPPAPDPVAMLLRLFGLTAAAILVCGGVLWLLKRAKSPFGPVPGAAGRLVHDGSLALDRRCSVHVIRADGQAVAVTTDATGLRSLVLLSEPFEKLLTDAEAGDTR